MKRLLALGLLLLPLADAHAEIKARPYKAQSVRYDLGKPNAELQAFVADLKQKVEADDLAAAKAAFAPDVRVYIYGLEARYTPPTKLPKPYKKSGTPWDGFLAAVIEGELPPLKPGGKTREQIQDEQGLGSLKDMLTGDIGRSQLLGNKACVKAQSLYDRGGIAAMKKATGATPESIRIVAPAPGGTQSYKVYADKSEKSEVIGSIKQNDIIVMDAGGDWQSMILPSGKLGYVDGDIALDQLMRVWLCFGKTEAGWKITDVISMQL